MQRLLSKNFFLYTLTTLIDQHCFNAIFDQLILEGVHIYFNLAVILDTCTEFKWADEQLSDKSFIIYTLLFLFRLQYS